MQEQPQIERWVREGQFYPRPGRLLDRLRDVVVLVAVEDRPSLVLGGELADRRHRLRRRHPVAPVDGLDPERRPGLAVALAEPLVEVAEVVRFRGFALAGHVQHPHRP
ncbi:hypothetical protein GCM10009734_44000 [Nonomuraea bangladeshensis]